MSPSASSSADPFRTTDSRRSCAPLTRSSACPGTSRLAWSLSERGLRAARARLRRRRAARNRARRDHRRPRAAAGTAPARGRRTRAACRRGATGSSRQCRGGARGAVLLEPSRHGDDPDVPLGSCQQSLPPSSDEDCARRPGGGDRAARGLRRHRAGRAPPRPGSDRAGARRPAARERRLERGAAPRATDVRSEGSAGRSRSREAERGGDAPRLDDHPDEGVDAILNHSWRLLDHLDGVVGQALTTIHYPLDAEPYRAIFRARAHGRFVSVSRSQQASLPELHFVANIYNGVDLAALPFRPVPDEYLGYLGRAAPEKGLDIAIRVAQSAGICSRSQRRWTRAGNRGSRRSSRRLSAAAESR